MFAAHNFPIFQPILMVLKSKFMVYIALSNKIYLSLGLLSPLTNLGRHPVFSKKHKLHTHSFGFNYLLVA